MKYIYLVWRNLMRKKLRTLLTLLCVLVAFILFGYLGAINQAFRIGVDVVGMDRLVVRNKISLIMPLPEAHEAKIEQVEGVDEAVFATWFGGYYQDPKNFFAQMPVRAEEFLDMFPEYVLDEQEKQAWFDTRTGAVVGKVTAERFGWEVGDRIPIFSPYQKKDGERIWEFDLVGIYEGAERGTDTSNFFFRHEYFDEAKAGMEGMIGWYWVRIEDPEQAAQVAAAIDETFANSPWETKSEPEGAFVQGFANQIGNIALIIRSILFAVFFTILLVAGNTMAQAVRERFAEIGTLKALGFTGRAVLGLILAEACLLVAVGGFLGLGIAWALVELGGDPTNGALPVFFIPPLDMAIGFGLVFLVGLLTGILPALQAQRLSVVDALRR